MATQRFLLQRRKTGYGRSEYYMTPEQEEAFRQLYATTPVNRLVYIFGISRATQKRFADELGLKKDIEGIALQRIQSERRRVQLGFSQNTRIHIPVYNYTSSQRYYRNVGRLRGYIPGDFHENSGERYTIYYDAFTQRSEEFEAGLQTAGLTLKEHPTTPTDEDV